MPPISKIIQEVVEAVRKPAVPEAALRGTAAHPTVLENVRPRLKPYGPDVPVPGVPEVVEKVNVTEDRSKTLADHVHSLKTHIGGLIRPDPNLPKDVGETLYKGRWRKMAAQEISDRDVGNWFQPLQTDPIRQGKLVHNYMTTADEVAQAQRYGKTHIRDIPIETWQTSLDELQHAVDGDTEVQEALKRIRTDLDLMFEDMVARGWIERTRYLSDYTPIRRVNAVLDGLAGFYGEDAEALKTRLLAQQQKRTGLQAPREVDLVQVFRATRGEYLRKVAEHEAFLDLASDPTLNVTEKFVGGQEIPKGFSIYRPGAGGFGSTIKSKEGYFIDGAMKAMDPKGQLNVGGFVFPDAVVQALEHFNTPVHTGSENWWYRNGTKIAKMLTVYNPANTNVNRFSDLLVALTTPGETGGNPLGILRWYGKATTAAYKGSFERGAPTIVELHGRKVDIWDLAIREGVTSGTIAHDLGSGIKLPEALLRLHPEAAERHQNWWEGVKRTLEADRLAVEASPRIAAGLEAVERTGDWSQFGKVARDVTFRYGAGAPRVSQFPAIRMLSPFLQFQGLATARILEMANSKNMATKAKLALGAIAVPLSIHMWNDQNDAYRQVELSLPDYERNQLHIIVPDPIDPAKPRLDVEGAPVILRFRYWVPEQVVSMIGMGNLPARADRVLKGRDTPIQFLAESGKSSAESISNMLVLPSVIQQALTGKAQSGQELDSKLASGPLGRAIGIGERVAPGSRIITKSLERGLTYGPGEAAKTAVLEASGARFAQARRADVKLMDAQLQDAVRELNGAIAKLTAAAKNKTGMDVKKAAKLVQQKKAEVRRIKDQIDKEKAAGYKPPKADKSKSARRREDVKRARKE